MGVFNRKKKNRGSPVDELLTPIHESDSSSSLNVPKSNKGFGSRSFKDTINGSSSLSGSLSFRSRGFGSLRARSKTLLNIPNIILSPVSDSNSPYPSNDPTPVANPNTSTAGSDAQNSSPDIEDSDSFSNFANSAHHCAASLPVLSPTMAAIEARTEEMFKSMRRSKISSGDTSPPPEPSTGMKKTPNSYPHHEKNKENDEEMRPVERRWTSGLVNFMSRRGIFGSSGSPSSRTANSDLSSNWLIDFNELSIGRSIGHSSFGNVCQGQLNGTNVAVKSIKCESNDVLVAFQKEAELNCKLRHPNIVLFMGICVHPTKVSLVTELMSRGNVREMLIKDIRLDWGVRLRWALDTARGMAYLHSLDPPMIHCDLKTTNLLVDRGMNVKICDFGLSRFRSDKDLSAVGTVHFSAPEVLRDEYYTESADVFSFGTVMWELYTRKCVFDGLSKLEIYQAVMNGHMPSIDSGCDANYEQLMKDCWEMDPKSRPTFREAIDRLSALVEEQDVSEG